MLAHTIFALARSRLRLLAPALTGHVQPSEAQRQSAPAIAKWLS